MTDKETCVRGILLVARFSCTQIKERNSNYTTYKSNECNQTLAYQSQVSLGGACKTLPHFDTSRNTSCTRGPGQ